MIEYTVKVWSSGDKLWYLKGKLHREDGPAIEYANGDKHWYLNGKLHRVDGPAFECANGDKEWYLNGKLHREDGPAMEYANGNKFWYLNGKQLTEAEFNSRTKDCNGKVIEVDGKKYKLVAC
jgi:antitoxin component YwqK of YwqJK toxin-antitoxin module